MSTFSVKDTKSSEAKIAQLCSRLLHVKQRLLLQFLLKNSNEPITRLINLLSTNLECSNSCVWHHLRVLRNLELVKFGSGLSKGIAVSVTDLGRIVAREGI